MTAIIFNVSSIRTEIFTQIVDILHSSNSRIYQMKGELRRNAASMLFADLGPIFVDKETAPPQADLIDLITLCGGKVRLVGANNKILLVLIVITCRRN